MFSTWNKKGHKHTHALSFTKRKMLQRTKAPKNKMRGMSGSLAPTGPETEVFWLSSGHFITKALLYVYTWQRQRQPSHLWDTLFSAYIKTNHAHKMHVVFSKFSMGAGVQTLKHTYFSRPFHTWISVMLFGKVLPNQLLFTNILIIGTLSNI